MSPPRSTWRCRPAGWTKPSPPIDPGCCPTTVQAMSRATSPNGSTTATSNTGVAPLSPNDPGQDRALAPDAQEPHLAGKLLPARRSRSSNRGLRRRLQPLPLPREHRQSYPGRRLLRARPDHPGRTRKDQATDHCQSSPAAPTADRLTSPIDVPEPPLFFLARCPKNSDDGQPRPTISRRPSVVTAMAIIAA